MFKRFLVIACMGCAAMVSPVWLAAQTATQDQSYFTYVSQWAVPRAEWANFEKQEKDDDALMQKLVADGTLIDYGDSTSRVHTEDGYTHADWFTASSRANLLKALEEVYKNASNAALVATTKHCDFFLRSLAHGGKPASSATGYLRVVFWQARPGTENALEAHVMTAIKPTLDKDVANGTLLMYNFDKEDIHTNAPGGYNLALLFPDGAAMDKFFAELAAAEKQNAGTGDILDNLTEAKEHRDILGRVTVYGHK